MTPLDGETEPGQAVTQNWTVQMVGLAYTEIDMLAKSPEEAAEKALTWARGRRDKDQFNDIDLVEWEVDPNREVWLSDDQTPAPSGRTQEGSDGEPTTAFVWSGAVPRDRCTAATEHYDCDLMADHDGPHFYVLDHDLDEDVSHIATWPNVSQSGSSQEADGG